MQTKKRAKPVKFGSAKQNPKHKQKEPEKDSENLHEGEPDKNLEQDEQAVAGQDPEEGKGVEAHFSSSVETLDIKDIEPAEKEDLVEESEKDDEASDDAQDEPLTKEEEESEEKSLASEQALEESKESLIEKDGAFFSSPPDGNEKKKSMTGYFFIVAFVTFVLGLTFFAGIYYAVTNRGELFSGVHKPTPTVTEPTPIPTEKPVDLAAYGIRVLNGTGTAGLAAKLKEELETAGFKVVSTGNADTDDFTKTQIEAVKKVDKAYLDKLKEALGKSHEVGDIKTLSSSSADVVVTIGSSSAN